MPAYVDVHILQTVPPSNLNRDDAGSPKQATYGGVKRARVSSQAWKRATRTAFAEHVDQSELGTRTRRISGLLAERLAERGSLDAEAANRIATTLLVDLAIKPGKKATETAYLLFFGRPQLERLVDQVADRLPELTALDDAALKDALAGVSARDVLGSGHPIDVSLFGRMVADIPTLNVDAATQVAHAISTHAVQTEFDYFTAVDDQNTEAETGAGMIGTVEFQSATLYRYATVALPQLLDNLGGDEQAALEALRVFLIAFTTSMPTGHQNSFGHRTPPNLLAVVIREDQPVNLVSAFERPVLTTDGGLVGESVRRLANELDFAALNWGLVPAVVLATYDPNAVAEHDRPALDRALGPARPFSQVVEVTLEAARSRLSGGLL